MKKLYQKFFYIPKRGKIHDRVMQTYAVATVVFILACLSVMTITAYAFFSVGVASMFNTVRAAAYDVNISVTPASGSMDAVPVDTSVGNTKIVTLTKGMHYTVTITKAATATASTGFCSVKAMKPGSNESWPTTYFTRQIGMDQGVNQEPLSFELVVGDYYQVQFTPSWGTPSCYGQTSNDCYLSPGVGHSHCDNTGHLILNIGYDEQAENNAEETAVPEVVEIPIIGTQTVDPETVQAELVDAVAPETVAPETVGAETVAPETVAPETVGPETVAPETVGPETVGPETVAPETVAPETVAPETVTIVPIEAPSAGGESTSSSSSSGSESAGSGASAGSGSTSSGSAGSTCRSSYQRTEVTAMRTTHDASYGRTHYGT